MNKQQNSKLFGNAYPQATTFMGKMKENGWGVELLVIMFFMNGITSILEFLASNRPTALHVLWALLGGFLLFCVRLISKRDYLSVQFSIVALCAIFFLTAYPLAYGVSINAIFGLIITELVIFPVIITYLLTSKRVKWLFQERPENNDTIQENEEEKAHLRKLQECQQTILHQQIQEQKQQQEYQEWLTKYNQSVTNNVNVTRTPPPQQPTPFFQKASQAIKDKLKEYHSGCLSNAELGRFYERYIGYLYEQENYRVSYNGIITGEKDACRDLICWNEEKNQTLVIQTKCWSKKRPIRKDIVSQIYNSAKVHSVEAYINEKTIPMIITSSWLDKEAKALAKELGVQYRENVKLDKNYPLVKRKGDYYYLPFEVGGSKIYDQLSDVEYYHTIEEVEKLNCQFADK